jgi:urate oxidase
MGQVEDFGLRLARHFASEFESIQRARVSIEEVAWSRLGNHAFARGGSEKRLATVTCTKGGGESVLGGVTDLVVLKTTDSEFHGYIKDRYTTLPETRDRIMATSLTARWRFARTDLDWKRCYSEILQSLTKTFADHHSLSLQQTLYEMGKAVLEAHEEVAEVRLSMPNKHHFVVDLSPFDIANENEVFYASDRPYGLIEGTVKREGAPDAPEAW